MLTDCCSRLFRRCLFVVASIAVGSPAVAILAQDAAPLTFEDHVQPIFRQRCAACHQADKKSGGLDLTNYTNLMLGGSSGSVIEPGDAEGSYLYMLITHEEEPAMPPNSPKIPAEELRLIEGWIDNGALETKTSKANIKRKKVDLSVSGNATERPAQVAVLPRLILEPAVDTDLPPTATPLAVSPWTSVVALGGTKQILLYDVSSLELRGVLPFPEGRPNVLRFSRSGRILLAGGGTDAVSGKVVLWDVATGRRIAEIGDELDTVLSADISSDHQFVALGGPQRVLRVYAVATGELVYERRKHTDWVTSIAFSPDGVLLASGDRNGNVFVWETHTGNEYLTLRGHSQMITELAWRLDSNLLASACDDTTIRWWELENGGQVKSIGAHGGGTNWVAFTRDGMMVSGGRDGAVKLWNNNGDQQLQFAGMSDIAVSAVHCAESQRVIGSDWKGNVVVWNAADGSVVGSLAANPPLLAERLAQAESHLATTTQSLNEAESGLAGATQEWQTAADALAALTAQQSQQQSSLVENEQSLAAKRAVAESKAAEQQAWSTELAEKQGLQPSLSELADKARAVAELSPQDTELQATAQQLAEKLAKTDSRIQELQRLTTESQSLQTELTAQMQTLEQQVNTLRSALETTTAQVNEAQQIADQKQATLTASQQLRDQAQVAVQQAEQQAARWRDEIAFVAQLRDLESQLVAAEEQINSRAESRDVAAEQVAQAQQKLQEAEQQVSEAEAAARAVQASIDALQRIQ